MKAEIHMMRRLIEGPSKYGQCVSCEPVSARRMRERPAEATLRFHKETLSLIERSRGSRGVLLVSQGPAR